MTLIGLLFHVSCTLGVEGTWRVLKRRHGWSRQQAVRRAIERDDGAVEVWKKETLRWVRASRRSATPGSSVRTRPGIRCSAACQDLGSDLRITSVRCETGETVLWKSGDGIDLVTAMASSCAVPGFFPVLHIDGGHYCDEPRTPSAKALAEEKCLDAIVFIGARAGALANVAEDAELDDLARQGLRIVKITDGPEFAEVVGELMDQGRRPHAAQIGLADGRRAASRVAGLL